MRRGDTSASLNDEQARVASAGVKGLIPVGTRAGRPFLDYVLSALADAGIREVCLVIGPEHTELRDYFEGPGQPRRLRVCFAIQQDARGTADAVLAAEEFAAGEDVLVLNSDNYYPPAAYRLLRDAEGAALPGFDRDALFKRSNIDPERIRSFALLDMSPEGELRDIVEKPDARTFERMGPHALVSMNLWRLPREIYHACRQVHPSARGELELPDAVRYAIREMRVPFHVLPIAEGVLDLSSRADVAAVSDALASVIPDP